MAIEPRICTSFRQEMLLGLHDLEGDTLKMALYNDSATIDVGTAVYTVFHEIVQSGYTAGGVTLENVSVSIVGDTVVFDCDDAVWESVTFSSDPPRVALLYNASQGNKAFCVINFGSNQIVTSGDFKFAFSSALQGSTITFV